MFLVQTIKRKYKGFSLRAEQLLSSIEVLLLPVDVAMK